MLETRNNITQNTKNTTIRISEKKASARAKASNGIIEASLLPNTIAKVLLLTFLSEDRSMIVL